jgi:hypothetical protein
LGRISSEDYQLGINKVYTNKVKLAIRIEETQESKAEEEKGSNPFEEVPVKGKEIKEENKE